jgi:hypothetical protein
MVAEQPPPETKTGTETGDSLSSFPFPFEHRPVKGRSVGGSIYGMALGGHGSFGGVRERLRRAAHRTPTDIIR